MSEQSADTGAAVQAKVGMSPAEATRQAKQDALRAALPFTILLTILVLALACFVWWSGWWTRRRLRGAPQPKPDPIDSWYTKPLDPPGRTSDEM